MGLFTRDTDTTPTPEAEALLASLTQRAAAANTPRALTAASSRVRLDDRKAITRLQQATTDAAWQSRAWNAYESVGEIHFAFNLIGNVISRIRFYPAADISPNVAPAYVSDAPDLTPGIAQAAEAAMRRISDSHGDFSTLSRHLAINLGVVGEAYLVQIPASTNFTSTGTIDSSPESWEVRSRDEIMVSNDPKHPIRVRSRPNSQESDMITLPQNAFVGRIWRKNPRYSNLADSSLSPVLDLVDELMLINQTFKATARSRLNSGILFIPDGLTASSPVLSEELQDGNPPSPADVDEFEEALIEGMMTPIADPSNASAVVPILVRGATELGEKIRLIQFDRTFDPSLVQRSDRVLERILQGIDLPKDIVSGLANVRYSNAQTIEESLWRAHIEPLVLMICDALSDVYLRPALMSSGYTREQAARCRIWYDPSEIVTRPNRNQDAVAAFDRYALSARSLREANGFNEADAPTPSELMLRMLLQKGPMTPDLAEALMRAIAPLTMNAAQDAAQESGENPLPPEVQDLLNPNAAPAPAPAPAAEDQPAFEPEPENAPPAEPAGPAPRAANARGPRGGRAAETPLDPDVSLLPPAP